MKLTINIHDGVVEIHGAENPELSSAHPDVLNKEVASLNSIIRGLNADLTGQVNQTNELRQLNAQLRGEHEKDQRLHEAEWERLHAERGVLLKTIGSQVHEVDLVEATNEKIIAELDQLRAEKGELKEQLDYFEASCQVYKEEHAEMDKEGQDLRAANRLQADQIQSLQRDLANAEANGALCEDELATQRKYAEELKEENGKFHQVILKLHEHDVDQETSLQSKDRELSRLLDTTERLDRSVVLATKCANLRLARIAELELEVTTLNEHLQANQQIVLNCNAQIKQLQDAIGEWTALANGARAEVEILKADRGEE